MLTWEQIRAEIDGIKKEMDFVNLSIKSSNVFHTNITDEIERVNKRVSRFRAVIEHGDWERSPYAKESIMLDLISDRYDMVKASRADSYANGVFYMDQYKTTYMSDDMWTVFLEYIESH